MIARLCLVFMLWVVPPLNFCPAKVEIGTTSGNVLRYHIVMLRCSGFAHLHNFWDKSCVTKQTLFDYVVT